MTTTRQIAVTVNGQPAQLNVEARTLLADALRADAGIHGI